MSKTWNIQLSDRPDSPGSRVATITIDGKVRESATGPDDIMALQNLSTKLRAKNYPEEDVRQVLGLFYTLTGQDRPWDPGPND